MVLIRRFEPVQILNGWRTSSEGSQVRTVTTAHQVVRNYGQVLPDVHGKVLNMSRYMCSIK